MRDTSGNAPFEASALRAVAKAYDDRRLIADHDYRQNTAVLREMVCIARDISNALARDLEAMNRVE